MRITIDALDISTEDLIEELSERWLDKSQVRNLLDSVPQYQVEEYLCDIDNEKEKPSVDNWKEELWEDKKDKFTYFELEKLLNR